MPGARPSFRCYARSHAPDRFRVPERFRAKENGMKLPAVVFSLACGALACVPLAAAEPPEAPAAKPPAATDEAPADLDARVSAFLAAARGTWHDLNVPYEDGAALHRLVLAAGSRSILEIGTSTGHSTIWLAWAAAKTGGKVTTLEIDAERHRQARRNFEKAGLSGYIDARLGDAHELVKTLPGPFDFVFSDADKEWYLQYFLDLDPKLSVGGCFTAHNVLRPTAPEVQQMIDAIEAKPNYTTRIERTSPEGILVACKTKP
jgi:caffeoyl-CoA O-methyltransferase